MDKIIALFKTPGFYGGLTAVVAAAGLYFTGQATAAQAVAPLAIGLLHILQTHSNLPAPIAPAGPDPMADLMAAAQAAVTQAQTTALASLTQGIKDGLKDVGVPQ